MVTGRFRTLLRALVSLPPWVQLVGISALLLGVLDVSYVVIIPAAHYYALLNPQIDPVKLLEGFVLVAIVVISAPRDTRHISTIFIWLSLLLAYIPMLCLYGVRSYPRPFMYATAGFWLAVCILLRVVPRPQFPFVAPSLARRALPVLYAVFLVASAATIAWYAGLSIFGNLLHDLNLNRAYDARAAFVADHIPLNGYYLHWVALVFNPLFFALAALKRRWVPALAIFAAQLLVAAFVGMRTYFFVIPFVAALLVLAHGRRPLEKITAAFTSIVAAGMLAFAAVGNLSAYLLFTGRFMLDAAQLNFLYFDFFSKHGPIPLAYLFDFYLRLPVRVPYPYAEDPALTIGLVYYGQHGLGAVTGAVGDAFMNFGYWGLPIWAVMIVAVLVFADAVAAKVTLPLATAVVAMSAVALAQTYSVRVLFTTGFLWALVGLYLLSSTRPGEVSQSDARVPTYGTPRPLPVPR